MTRVQTTIFPANQPGLTEQELGKTYVEALRKISVRRTTGMYTDNEVQRMADAVREFHDLLTEAIHAKAAK